MNTTDWKRVVQNDGGPAYPATRDEYFDGPDGQFSIIKANYVGMSLRDFFAGQALIGQLSFSPHDSFDKAHYPSDVAALAYRFADAMLEEREK